MNMTQIRNWDEVDSTLKRLAELEVGIAKIAGDVTVKTNEIKEAGKDKAAPLQVEKEALEKQITLFCEANKHEFADKRSKELNFGTIGFRISTKLNLPRAKEKIDALIKTIKALGLKDCITYTETIDKDRVADLDDKTFARIGITRVVKDNFRIEPRIEEIENTVSV
jgi:phage host-nuclease inhibitor protein Gam